ncbi:phage head-tail connector protein [Allobaculum stercoricanis]|uniref:phage head-tail connector protein n=1 Tax=Allobaculum stercoricanis TaxID=174709 RepID=UPI002941EF4A|nr:hypothetical protein [Allobaculum stercoricanis]
MAEFNLLSSVKKMNGITGDYQDEILSQYIEEIKQYLMDGGVIREVVDSPTSAGVIAKGVSDLFYDGALSKYFKERAIQLSYKRGGGDNVPT